MKLNEATRGTVEDAGLTIVSTSYRGACLRNHKGEEFTIGLSRYTSRYEKQKELALALFKLQNPEITVDDTDENEIECDNFERLKRRSDYSGFHGFEVLSVKDSVESIDTRLEHYEEWAVHDYWKHGSDELDQDYLDELDPDNRIAVWHYKGKKFFFDYESYSEELTFRFRDEDGILAYDYLWVRYHFESPELLESCVQVIRGSKLDLEVNGLVSLEVDEKTRGEDNIISPRLFALLYEEEEESEAKSDIFEHADFTLATPWLIVQSGWEKTLEKRIVCNEDLTLRIGNMRYRHLKLLKAMETEYGYTLARSAVSAFDTRVAWGFEREGETYHFSYTELFESSPKALIKKALIALEKRKIERAASATLLQKASRVFISVEDSLESGNCRFGTNSFLGRYHIDTTKIGGIRGDELLRLESTDFTRRAVLYKIAVQRSHVRQAEYNSSIGG